MNMTEQDIDEIADELMELAKTWGEEIGRKRFGSAWESMPKGPDITELLREDLKGALRAYYKVAGHCGRCGSDRPNPACPDCCPENPTYTQRQI